MALFRNHYKTLTPPWQFLIPPGYSETLSIEQRAIRFLTRRPG